MRVNYLKYIGVGIVRTVPFDKIVKWWADEARKSNGEKLPGVCIGTCLI